MVGDVVRNYFCFAAGKEKMCQATDKKPYKYKN